MSDKRTKILLIEDNPGDARLIQEMLAEAEPGRFELECVDQLSAGIKRLDQGDIDVILLDLDLPDSHGVDTFTKVYAQVQEKPIVVLTGLADETVGVKAVSGGAQDYLIKGQVDGNLVSRSIRYAIERKRMEEALRESEEQYRTLANSSPVGVYIVQDGKFCFVNPEFQKYTGFSEDELLKMEPLELVYPEDREKARQNAMQMLKGNRFSPYEFRVTRQGGEIHWAMETVTSIYYKEKRATLGNFMDITERKQMERQLQERNEQLDAQNEELQSQTEELVTQQQELIEKTREVERANQLKSEFLANMSHELRTPLNVIIGFAELMIDEVPGKVNKEQRQCLNDVLTSSRHLLNLINGVLDLSKIESGKVELKPENIALTGVIASLTRTMMPILTPRKQSLDVEIEEGLPLVYADEGKIAQVLLNLVDNASKFSPDGSELKVKAVREGDWCQVSVIDNGFGIKKEDQERIFEPFSRLDNPLVKGRGGTGLGLALVKQIVERYGGLIWVKSEYGKGSKFSFTLPLATSSKTGLKEKSIQ